MDRKRPVQTSVGWSRPQWLTLFCPHLFYRQWVISFYAHLNLQPACYSLCCLICCFYIEPDALHSCRQLAASFGWKRRNLWCNVARSRWISTFNWLITLILYIRCFENDFSKDQQVRCLYWSLNSTGQWLTASLVSAARILGCCCGHLALIHPCLVLHNLQWHARRRSSLCSKMRDAKKHSFPAFTKK